MTTALDVCRDLLLRAGEEDDANDFVNTAVDDGEDKDKVDDDEEEYEEEDDDEEEEEEEEEEEDDDDDGATTKGDGTEDEDKELTSAALLDRRSRWTLPCSRV